MNYDVPSDLVSGIFIHLSMSLYSLPSIDKPGHSGHMCTGVAKWISNPKMIYLINEVHEKWVFQSLSTHQMLKLTFS